MEIFIDYMLQITNMAITRNTFIRLMYNNYFVVWNLSLVVKDVNINPPLIIMF